jgi:hypothetical protein
LKLKRALVHLNELNVACNLWLGKNGKPTPRIVSDPGSPGYILVKATASEVPQEQCSLLIGDVVQNLRNALDHLAYSLAVVHSGAFSYEDARDRQFPIIGDRSAKGAAGMGPQMFKSAAPKLIKKISAQAQAIIEGLPPFKLGGQFKTHALRKVNELANCDKHRFIHVAACMSSGFMINPSASTNCTIGPGLIQALNPIMDGETVIAKIPAKPTNPNLQMNVDISPVLLIGFADGISCKKDVVKELTEIHIYVVTTVNPHLCH